MKIALIAILAGIAYTASANQCNLAKLKEAMVPAWKYDDDGTFACYGNGKDFATEGASFVNLAFHGVEWGEAVLEWR